MYIPPVLTNKVTVKNAWCLSAKNHRSPEGHDGHITEPHNKLPLRQAHHPKGVPLTSAATAKH